MMLACLPRRRPILLVGLALLGSTLLLGPLPAQPPTPPAKPAAPPPEEEEEPGAKKPIKKIPVEEGPTTPATPPPPPPPMPQPPGSVPMPPMGQPPEAPDGDKGVYLVRLDDVARAAATATNPTIKQFLASLTVAHDRLHHVNFRVFRITPVPLRWGKDKFPAEFGIAPLNPDDTPGEVQTLQPRFVADIVPFELIAIERVTKFLEPGVPGPEAPKPADKFAAAERVLTAVMFFHDSARDQNRRRGKNWEPVKTAVYDKLTEVRIERVRQAAADRDWAQLKELSTRLIELYKTNPRVLEPVYAARLAEAEQLVKSDKVPDLERGRELLNEYDSRFPNTNNETAKRVRQALTARARKFLADAERQMKSNQTEARNILKTVEAIDPENSALRQLQQELKVGYPVLVVGTRRLPELMSPARARFDSERQAVSLLFEPLMERLPDEVTGVRFRPRLAAEWPLVGAGVRDLQLVRSASWGNSEAGVFDAADVAGTLRLFRQSPGNWTADVAAWLDEPAFDPGDPGRIRLRFKIGHPDPRQLLTLKLHPAQWLLQRNKTIEDTEFARRPFGTGAYRLAPSYRPPQPGEPPRDVVFVANPSFGRRPGRTAQPFIKEIRFADVAQYPDLLAELRADRVHILPDVPTAELSRFAADSGLKARLRVVTATQNRRTHILAINHRRPHLQHADLRRGLSAAIDRERVLNEVYRAGQSEYHRALTGPFPEGSWATPRTLAPTGLFNRDAAQARIRQYLAAPGAAPVLTLLCPDDDPLARSACEKMKGMIESATAGEERRLTISVEPVPPRELLRRVEELQNYDLAYLPFDYPDDWFPLGLASFLDPAASGPLGRNYLGYLTKESQPREPDTRLAAVLAECRLHRDFARLTELAHDAHRRFNEAVPFVPLWQLDRHMVISTAVKVHFDGQPEEVNPRLLDPTTLFSSIATWRVE